MVTLTCAMVTLVVGDVVFAVCGCDVVVWGRVVDCSVVGLVDVLTGCREEWGRFSINFGP